MKTPQVEEEDKEDPSRFMPKWLNNTNLHELNTNFNTDFHR